MYVGRSDNEQLMSLRGSRGVGEELKIRKKGRRNDVNIVLYMKLSPKLKIKTRKEPKMKLNLDIFF